MDTESVVREVQSAARENGSARKSSAANMALMNPFFSSKETKVHDPESLVIALREVIKRSEKST
jgi:hypothetical protein